MSIKLRKKPYKDGTTGFYLDIYEGGTRKYEFLTQLKLTTKPKTQADREHNKEVEALAKGILAKRQLSIANDEYGFETKVKRSGSFIKYFQSYIEGYNRKDKRKASSTLKFLNEFLENKDITFKQITDAFVNDFKEFLLSSSLTGETPSMYLSQLKKVVKKAYKDGLLKKNFGEDIRIPKSTAIRKDILTHTELKALRDTPCGNTEVKRAFMFSCNTGLRYVDIVNLRWKNIKQNNEGWIVSIVQSKTGKSVKVNLNENALLYLGQHSIGDEPVFILPSTTAITKNLKNWAKAAKVNKHITYHVARHTFGTMLVHHGTDVKTASVLMGHSSLNYTNLYIRESEALKQRAVENLPSF
jgi:integrase/recombinase XerD